MHQVKMAHTLWSQIAYAIVGMAIPIEPNDANLSR